MQDKKNLFFYASCIHRSDTMSGGDRIFIEIAKIWKEKDNIIMITSKEGEELCKKYGLNDLRYIVIGKHFNKKDSPAVLFLKRLFSGIKLSFNQKLPKNSLIYSTSNFISDAFPSFLLKILNKKIKWIGGYYLAPPNPFFGYDESKSKLRIPKLPDILFYIQDKASKFLINKFADIVYVTSLPDKNQFIKKSRPENKVLIIKGGIDIKTPDKVKNKKIKKFDAVFLGRFHREKGVLELVDIWEKVLKFKKGAKLAMIGNGPLEEEVKRKIKQKNLEKNIILFGFKDGIEKIKIFKDSKIVLHPAQYDSGGMAACEAMICKIPGVSYDLEALKTYYPKGMLKTEIGNQNQFARNILLLLKDKKLYNKLSKDAYELAKTWDWNKRAGQIYKQTFKN
ncbi:MAG: glycosyltransferase [Nanoarchaeota archaeon]|nr:glycosyltransferase [Nanoarchaeota archaeon]